MRNPDWANGLSMRTTHLVKSVFWNFLGFRGYFRQERVDLEDTVISLTSYPDRIGFVHKTVLSLLVQEKFRVRIILVLSVQEFPGRESSLPTPLKKIIDGNELVSLIWVEGNPRSYKKLLPTLERFPSFKIITVDDDVIYPRGLVRTLYEASQRHPSEIIGTRGVEILRDGSMNLAPYNSWPKADFDSPSLSIFLTGRGGILYPPNSLHPSVSEVEEAMKICPDADDVWFKCMAVKIGTKSMVVDMGGEFPGIFGSQKTALFRLNVAGGANDRIIKRACQELGVSLSSR